MEKRTRLRNIIVTLVMLSGLLFTGLPAAGKGIALRFWSASMVAKDKSYEAVLESFSSEHPDIKITLDPQVGFSAKVKTALAAGTTAALINVHGTLGYELALKGQLQQLNPDVVTYEWAEDNWWPENIKQQYGEKKIWIIGTTDALGDAGFVCNVDMMVEAGLEIPIQFASMDQLLRYAKKLAVYDSEGNLTRAGLSIREGNNPVFWWDDMLAMGGKFWNNETQKFDFNTPEGRKAMQWLHDLIFKYKVESVDLPMSYLGLSQQLAAMGYMWPEYVHMAEYAFPEVNFTLITKPPFYGTEKPVFSHSDTWNIGMPAGLSEEKKEAAFEFLRYVNTPEAQKIMREYNPGMSPLKELGDPDSYYYQKGRGKLHGPGLRYFPAVYYGPWGNQDILLYDICWPTMDSIYVGELTVEEGLAKMTKEANEELNELREKYPYLPETIIDWGEFN